jgi:Lrp/AsnC family leucine-responsive transcriptional regulator
MMNFMSDHVPDRVDRAIVAELQRDGRIANVDLADAVGLSPSACLRRVKALEASGIIAGYHAEVDRARAGIGLTVFIGLKVEGHSRETSLLVEQALLAIPEVIACHVVSGSDDFLVEAATPTWPAMSGCCSTRSWRSIPSPRRAPRSRSAQCSAAARSP